MCMVGILMNKKLVEPWLASYLTRQTILPYGYTSNEAHDPLPESIGTGERHFP